MWNLFYEHMFQVSTRLFIVRRSARLFSSDFLTHTNTQCKYFAWEPYKKNIIVISIYKHCAKEFKTCSCSGCFSQSQWIRRFQCMWATRMHWKFNSSTRRSFLKIRNVFSLLFLMSLFITHFCFLQEHESWNGLRSMFETTRRKGLRILI